MVFQSNVQTMECSGRIDGMQERLRFPARRRQRNDQTRKSIKCVSGEVRGAVCRQIAKGFMLGFSMHSREEKEEVSYKMATDRGVKECCCNISELHW